MHTPMARFHRLLFAGLIVLFAFMTTAPMFAAPPQFQTVPIDFTFVDENATNQCGFPVQISGSGTLKISTHELQTGKIVEIQRLLHATVTFTNLATDTSYTSRSAGPTIITIQPDGTTSIAGLGIFDIITLPGQGLLIKNVGRLVTDENGAIIFEAGSHPTVTGGNVQGLCTALS
jgi:hypothetical protein